MEDIVEKLCHDEHACVRYRMAFGFYGLPADSPEVKLIRDQVRDSSIVKTMLQGRNVEGKFPWHAYQKWKGAFWTLLILADLGYPAGDQSLLPLAEQSFEWIFSPYHLKTIPLIEGRWRRCACQEGGIVFSMIRLGLVDSRVEQLANSLLKWQWPDGGWNCDKHPKATHSSFNETFIPIRALNAYYTLSGDARFKEARDRGIEFLLDHSFYKRLSTGKLIKPAFAQLAYPGYWHYDLLYGLRTALECGVLNDPRCKDALDLLESKRLPDGGFPAETRYYSVAPDMKTGTSFVDWGGVSKVRSNPFISAEALIVLQASGRL
jgi:hypothetical protein